MPWFWIFYIYACVQKSVSGMQTREVESDTTIDENYEGLKTNPQFQNAMRVYKIEYSSVQKIMKGKKRLCQDKDGNKIMPCDEDSAVNFICLSTISGKVGSCEKFNDFVIPLCVQESEIVFTCGKLSTSPVCALDAKTKGLCKKKPYRKLCLTKESKLEVCKKGLNQVDENDENDENDKNDENYKNDDNDENYYYEYETFTEYFGESLSLTEDNDGRSNEKDRQQKKKREKRIPEVYKEETHRGKFDENDYGTYSEDEDDGMRKSENKMVRKLLMRMYKIHRNNTHLCKSYNTEDELINCDKVEKIEFACFGTNSRQIKGCRDFKRSEVFLPVCSQAKTNYLMTCDLMSNVNLCKSGKKRMYPCQDVEVYVCLGKDGLPSTCPEVKEEGNTRTPEMAAHPDNERFYHLHCSNCTIDNKMVVVGTPEDVLPETEFFTFPSA